MSLSQFGLPGLPLMIKSFVFVLENRSEDRVLIILSCMYHHVCTTMYNHVCIMYVKLTIHNPIPAMTELFSYSQT